APTSVVEGTAVNVGSTVTDGVDADTPLTYAWSVTSSNGQSASGTSSTFSFTPTDNGTYTVSLTATDTDNQAGTASQTLTVTTKATRRSSDLAPTSVVEGTAVSVGSTVTDGVDADTPLTYAWSVTSSNGQSASGTS